MPADPDPTKSALDELTARMKEISDGFAHITAELGTTNKVLADTRADQVTLRAAVREFTGTHTNNANNMEIPVKGNGNGNNNRHNHDKHPDQGPRILVDPPHFNGDNTTDWIDRIETYFDYYDTPDKDRMFLVRMLMDPPASGWFRYYRANNCACTWDEFLVALRHRFDPDYYVDYVGVLSNLRQTASVQEYQTSFEGILEKVSGVAESTLISLFVAGFKQPFQKELNIRRPATLTAVLALARELEACHQVIVPQSPVQNRRQWQYSSGPNPLDQSTANRVQTSHSAPISRAAAIPTGNTIPVVRLSTAEKADRQRRGLCWFCDERWVSGHKCSTKFLAFMGDDDDFAHPEIPILPPPDDIQEMPMTPVIPFRVYVGNGDSLMCSAYCPKTLISLQGHDFEIDLYILAIHGPDVVLGVQWLQTLGDVTHNYAKLTVQFDWKGAIVRLAGDTPTPRSISLHSLTAMIEAGTPLELYELLHIHETPQGRLPNLLNSPQSYQPRLPSCCRITSVFSKRRQHFHQQGTGTIGSTWRPELS